MSATLSIQHGASSESDVEAGEQLCALKKCSRRSGPPGRSGKRARVDYGQLTSNEIKLCRQVCRALYADCKRINPFISPVSPNAFPDYYTGPNAVAKPISLCEIEARAKRAAYNSYREFKRDLDLMWANCRHYHRDRPDSAILEDVRILEAKVRMIETKTELDVERRDGDALIAPVECEAVESPPTNLCERIQQLEQAQELLQAQINTLMRRLDERDANAATTPS